MRRAAALLAGLLFALACGGGGAGSTSAAGSPKPGGTLTYASESELRTLDPVPSTQLVERTVMYQIYESLVTIDDKLNVRPGLARSWDVPPDGLTYTFHLQTGVKFQDGTDFNAEAVRFEFDRIRRTASSPRNSELASVESVEAKDPATAVYHLKKPDSTLLAQLVDRAGMIVSPAAVQKAGADFGRNPGLAGTGPFEFVEWKQNDHLTIRRNPGYWKKGLPLLDQIVYRPVINDDARAAGLKTGEIDMARTLAGKDIAAAKSDSTLTYRSVAGLNFQGFELNHAAPPFNDKAKAQAVAAALDRDQYIKNVLFGNGVKSHGPIPPSSWAYDPGEKLYDKPDVNRAKSLASGFSFKLKVTNNPVSIQAGTLIKDQLSKAGITVELQVEEFGQILTETEAHDFEAALVGWSGRIDPDGNMYSWFHTGGGNNQGRYSNPQVDKDLEDARTATDQSRRKQLYDDAQRLLVQDAAYVFIYHQPAEQISSTRVHGYVLFPDGMPRLAGVWKS